MQPLTTTAGRYIFCGAFRPPAFTPAARTLSGTLLCGVRTFLPLCLTRSERPSGPAAYIRIIYRLLAHVRASAALWRSNQRRTISIHTLGTSPDPVPSEPSGLLGLLLHVPVPWVFVLGYLLGVGLQFALHLKPHLPANTYRAISLGGDAIFITGAIIAGWGLVLFHKARTTTTPGKDSKAFVTRGPYRFTRNPMYVGLILAYLGEMGILVEAAPLIPLLLVIAYVNWTVIPIEENRLTTIFGGAYRQYCAQVPRWF